MNAQELNERFMEEGLLVLGIGEDGIPIAMPWPPEEDDEV
jgi:hypothetical protein